MFPSTYFGLFPAFPRDLQGFVAMSFAPKFDRRWREVIQPAIESVTLPVGKLSAHRVDLRHVGDSILTEILTGVARCRVFVADITTMEVVERRPFRSANVLYEVGLAHAVRLPGEVLLFRSDDDPLDFDVANVRVHRYAPDTDTDSARTLVRKVIEASLRELALGQSLAVRRAAESLDGSAYAALMDVLRLGRLGHSVARTMGQVLAGARRSSAIARLLDIGALQTEWLTVTPDSLDGPLEELAAYALTPFGRAILEWFATESGVLSAAMREDLEREIAGGTPGPTEGQP